ncbi:MAG: beta-ketoacyl synthase N-terminal-like domain-containing protein [Phycisphaerales bacterium]|nr:beta-ketoacyl synthase N-terminal-like domain-containing protein [Phycisphaerales bacterium]
MNQPETLVLTAASASCSLGEDRRAILAAMLEGGVEIDVAPGIEGVFKPDADGAPVPEVRAAQVSEAEPVVGSVPDRAERMLARSIRRGLDEAGLDPATIRSMRSDGTRIETLFGTTLGGMRHLGAGMRNGRLDVMARTTTSTVTRHALEGTGLDLGGSTVSAACASGVSALAMAGTAILAGEADLVVAIAYDPISEFAYAGFHCLRLVAAGPLRPFTEDRAGMRLGEGYGVFVVERESAAVARGATVLARILGWGGGSDAHHLTQPVPTGRGAADALRSATAALDGTGLVPDLVAAHATSTPANDLAEHAALASCFGERLPEIPVTALKSRIGHTLGAAGAVELSVVLAAMEHGAVPAAANATVDRDAFPTLDLVTPTPRHDATVDRAAVVSLGFGGADAAILVESGTAVERVPPRPPVTCDASTSRIVITGVGSLVPEADDPQIRPGEIGLDEASFDGLDDARAVRRLARFSKLVRAAGVLATRDAGLDDEAIRTSSGFVGTRFGASDYTLDFYTELVRDGLGAGNPLHFAESVPNIGSAQLSLGLGIQGLTLSVGGTAIAGLEAMHHARRHLATGQADRAIVVAAEETHPQVREVLRHLGEIGDLPSAEGAIAFVLERESAAIERGATILAVLEESGLEWPKGESVRDSLRTIQGGFVRSTNDAIRGPARETRAGRRVAIASRLRPISGRPERCTVDHATERVERESVGAFRAIANVVRGSNGGLVVWPDPAGGAAFVRIAPVSSDR